MRNELFATSMIWNNATSSLDMLDIEHIYYNGRDERAKRAKHEQNTHTERETHMPHLTRSKAHVVKCTGHSRLNQRVYACQ